MSTNPPGAEKAFRSSLSITPKCQGSSARSLWLATQRPTWLTYFCSSASLTNGAAPKRLPVISRPSWISSAFDGFLRLKASWLLLSVLPASVPEAAVPLSAGLSLPDLFLSKAPFSVSPRLNACACGIVQAFNLGDTLKGALDKNKSGKD